MRFAKMIRWNSLSLKLLLAFVAGSLLSIALVVTTAFLALNYHVLARMDLANAVEGLSGKVIFDGNGMPLGFDSSIDDLAWLYEGPQRETAYRILDDSGTAIVLSSAGEHFWPADTETPRLIKETFEFTNNALTIYAATEPFQHDGRTWYLQFAASARFMELLHQRIALPLVLSGITVFSLVLFVAFGACAYITLRYTLKPLRDVSDSAAAISPRSIHARLDSKTVPSEITPLVESFNRALERLEQGYRLQKEFMGNAAHELKTPLALIRAQIELEDGSAGSRRALLGDVEYMSRQVQQLLLLAEVSEAGNYQFQTVDVHDVADQAVQYLQRMAQAADVRLLLSAASPDIIWHADRGALFTLLKNLLENAIQHAPANTVVQLDIQPDGITVRDMGPGVDPAQLPRLFERFWRGEGRRDLGAGLGLAICHEIAMAHGWQLAAEPANPGLLFRLSNRPQDSNA